MPQVREVEKREKEMMHLDFDFTIQHEMLNFILPIYEPFISLACLTDTAKISNIMLNRRRGSMSLCHLDFSENL